jgi:ADP-ribose pyrophosphatase YjhB (NUDIX family)
MNEPRVGCGVAITRGNRILLIQRLKEPEAGCWSLAGGKVDWQEPVPDAACREVEEELGIAVTLDCLLGVLDLVDRNGSYHWVSPIYHAERISGEPRLMEPHKHGGMGWCAADDLPHPLAEAARFAVERLFTGASRSGSRLATRATRSRV